MRRLTVGKGVFKPRDAADRLPPSTAAMSVRIASNRSIELSVLWKASSEDCYLLPKFGSA
jgi:hypothetical protein